jgi:[NiFe] hydrogenase diaphorase moiety large subunit
MGSGAYICGRKVRYSSLWKATVENLATSLHIRLFPDSVKNLPLSTTWRHWFIHYDFPLWARKFKELGTADSRGSKVFSISGDTPKPGIYELELGMTVEQFVDEFGDGDTKAVQVGGASGFCVPRKKFKDTIIGFEGVPTGGSMMLFNSSRSCTTC